MATLERVKALTAEHFGADEDEITPDTSFTEDLGADSLDLVEMTMAVEEEFGITIPDDDTAGLTTVGALVQYVDAKGEG